MNVRVQKDQIKEKLEKDWYEKPFLVAGPCSAESPEQLDETARLLLAESKIKLFRAGIWKPRTRPGSFEGLGNKALPWLQEIRSKYKLPTAVEVATAKQVEEALKHEVDVLWIGARTTVNPFSVQEIADALKGTYHPVLVKNPLNPDVELWTGAVERVAQSSLGLIGLVHRGFSTYGNTYYRNAPMWHLAIEMRRRFPDLILLNDPSHIAGKREGLQAVAQKAINLDFDGLMIESHCNPDKALSDAKQQVSPTQLYAIIDKLIWRSNHPKNGTAHPALDELRQRIDQIDEELLELLSRRMKIADEIGLYKKKYQLTILQVERWNYILNKGLAAGPHLKLSDEFIRLYYEAVHLESIQHQNQIMQNSEPLNNSTE